MRGRMKRSWIGVALLLFLLAVAGFLVLEKEGRATDYRRCHAVLKGVLRQWESRGRPAITETQTMLEEWKGTKPYVFTNEVIVGTNRLQAVFALPATDFGEKGTLVIATNGILFRIFEDGRISVVR